MRTFDAAIIGCGGISSMHLGGYAPHGDRLRVTAACDIIPERAEAACEKYGIEKAFRSAREMTAAADFEVAVVCTPTPVRDQIVAPLAEAGKHVFVEKPLCDSIGEAGRTVAACDAGGVKLAVNQTFRYHYAFDIARSVVAEGRVGKVLTITHRNPMFRQDSGWRLQCRRHALAVMGIHWLDGFRWALRCDATTVDCRIHSSPAIDCLGETDAIAQIVFENDTVVSFMQSFSCHGGDTQTVVVGESGTLVLSQQGAALFDKDNHGKPRETWQNPYAGKGKPETAFKLLNELLAAVEDGGEPPNNGRDNLKSVSLLEACYRSAERREPVSLKGGLIE